MTRIRNSAVRRYLDALELELKQIPGVSPEEALSDAREFLTHNGDALNRAEPGLSDEEVYEHFVEVFGTPKEVSAAYGECSEPFRDGLCGRAPGWRICCTRCGRSAPAEKVGITRIGAVSWHKYTLGYCRACRRLRWLRIIRDQQRSNLTRVLGADRTPRQALRSMHHPLLTVVSAIALALLLSSIPWLFAN